MSLSPNWRFIQSLVGDAPDFKGVYVLWANDVPLAVGRALGTGDTVRDRELTREEPQTKSDG